MPCRRVLILLCLSALSQSWRFNSHSGGPLNLPDGRDGLTHEGYTTMSTGGSSVEEKSPSERKRVADDDSDEESDDDDYEMDDSIGEDFSYPPDPDDDDSDDKGDVDRLHSDTVEENEEDSDLRESVSIPMNISDEELHQQSIDCIQTVWRQILLENSPTHNLNSSVGNSSDKMNIMFKQIFTQFSDPLAMDSSHRRSRWLDQEFVLTLKGLGILANNPLMMKSKLKNTFPHISRAIKLVSTKATQSLQLLIARALSASIKSHTLVLNRKTMDNIKDRIEALGASRNIEIPKAMLIRAQLLNTLFHMASYEDIPITIVLPGDLSWILDSISVCDALIDEIKNAFSTVFFIMLSSQNVPQPSSPPPNNDMQSLNDQLLQQLGEMGINLPPGGLFGPGMPPGFTAPDGVAPHAIQVFSRSNIYVQNKCLGQVSMKNGSMIVSSMSGGPFPPTGMPPNEVMRRIMQDQQKRLQGEQCKLW